MEIEVSFNLKVSAKYTKQEIFEWIYYQLHYSSSISLSNPLSDEDIDPENVNIEIN